jgi:hypothetical protein
MSNTLDASPCKHFEGIEALRAFAAVLFFVISRFSLSYGYSSGLQGSEGIGVRSLRVKLLSFYGIGRRLGGSSRIRYLSVDRDGRTAWSKHLFRKLVNGSLACA